MLKNSFDGIEKSAGCLFVCERANVCVDMWRLFTDVLTGSLLRPLSLHRFLVSVRVTCDCQESTLN